MNRSIKPYTNSHPLILFGNEIVLSMASNELRPENIFFVVHRLNRVVGSEIRIKYKILHNEKLART